LVEQRIENPRVRGSIPRLATKDYLVKSPVHTDGAFSFRSRMRQAPCGSWQTLP